jgi:hypothetical protein
MCREFPRNSLLRSQISEKGNGNALPGDRARRSRPGARQPLVGAKGPQPVPLHRRLGIWGISETSSLVTWRVSCEPDFGGHALVLGGSDLVTDPFACDLPLELGKGQQHIEGQPFHRARRIKLLDDRYERHALRVEDLNHPAKSASDWVSRSTCTRPQCRGGLLRCR